MPPSQASSVSLVVNKKFWGFFSLLFFSASAFSSSFLYTLSSLPKKKKEEKRRENSSLIISMISVYVSLFFSPVDHMSSFCFLSRVDWVHSSSDIFRFDRRKREGNSFNFSCFYSLIHPHLLSFFDSTSFPLNEILLKTKRIISSSLCWLNHHPSFSSDFLLFLLLHPPYFLQFHPQDTEKNWQASSHETIHDLYQHRVWSFFMKSDDDDKKNNKYCKPLMQLTLDFFV